METNFQCLSRVPKKERKSIDAASPFSNAKAIEQLKTFRGHLRNTPQTIAKLFSLGSPKIAKP
jgi:hypothetical protein